MVGETGGFSVAVRLGRLDLYVCIGCELEPRDSLRDLRFSSSWFDEYLVLTPAALNFFVNYGEGVVESLWSIDQYFELVLVLMFSTGLSSQVPVIQLLLGQVGLVSGDQKLSIWRYVVVAAAIVTPTDPLTQLLLAGPLVVSTLAVQGQQTQTYIYY
ncbi:hypothetical protein POM88_018774 [Heracleum sosnowskyi]|uniref:Uncharacterized protein n=1 Tax=Heracleum sosnowskyi TaxID=360622 RepID=A0AAD8ITK4_9APIA|nr:hypothetical protein POM88_018774 [Heracleum sosnowskyi]